MGVQVSDNVLRIWDVLENVTSVGGCHRSDRKVDEGTARSSQTTTCKGKTIRKGTSNPTSYKFRNTVQTTVLCVGVCGSRFSSSWLFWGSNERCLLLFFLRGLFGGTVPMEGRCLIEPESTVSLYSKSHKELNYKWKAVSHHN